MTKPGRAIEAGVHTLSIDDSELRLSPWFGHRPPLAPTITQFQPELASITVERDAILLGGDDQPLRLQHHLRSGYDRPRHNQQGQEDQVCSN